MGFAESEIDERPQALDVVEVDPDTVPDEQAPALVDRDDGAKRRVEGLADRLGVGDVGEAVRARARLRVVGSLVGDEPCAAGVLLAQLQAPGRAAEVRVALAQDAPVGK